MGKRIICMFFLKNRLLFVYLKFFKFIIRLILIMSYLLVIKWFIVSYVINGLEV